MKRKFYGNKVKGQFFPKHILKLAALLFATFALIASMQGNSIAATKYYTFGSASASGAWFVGASAMGKIISENLDDYQVTGVTTPGASRENVMRVNDREMELGWSTPDILMAGYEGTEPYEEKQDILGWFCPYESYVILVARKKTDATKVSDLKGKKIATGTPGSATQVFNDEVFFPAHGMQPGKDYEAENIRLPEAVKKIVDGHIDAAIYMVPAGNPGYQEMATSTKLNFIPVDEKAKDEIRKKRPSFYFSNIEPGTYRGVEEPVEAVTFAYQVFVGSYLDDDFVYEATKAIFDNLKFIKDASSSMKPLTLEKALQGMPIPVHPGALKYFEEKGVENVEDFKE